MHPEPRYAKEVVIIIAGFNKARAVREVIEGGVSHMWTVSMLQLHEHAIIALDDQFQNGELPEEAYKKRRLELRTRLQEAIETQEAAKTD